MKDPPRKGHRHFQYPQKCICNTFSTSEKKDSLPTRDEMAGSKVSLTQRVHCIL